ncbi:MAG: acyl-ACP--UDP-N-acetylglucosamine O-acyltransferase [Melioribacteraceae bacterium]
MNKIHPTAIVSSKAQLGTNNIVGPYTIIEDDVVIGNDCIIGSHVGIYDGARIGNKVTIYQSVSVANHPQDLKFNNEPTTFVIGDGTTVREFVTLNRGTVDSGTSIVGKNCLLMAYSHIAHDCIVGDNCIIANVVQLGGHVTIGDSAIIGGASVIHQFCKIGEHVMMGGGYRAVTDIPPFIISAGEPLKFSGVNTIGLRRRGFSNQEIAEIKEIYNVIFSKEYNLTQAKEIVIEKFKNSKHAETVLTFLDNSTRGIVKK